MGTVWNKNADKTVKRVLSAISFTVIIIAVVIWVAVFTQSDNSSVSTTDLEIGVRTTLENGNDGSKQPDKPSVFIAYNGDTFSYGYINSKTLTWKNYEFVGWSKEKIVEGPSAVVSSENVEENGNTYYAVWKDPTTQKYVMTCPFDESLYGSGSDKEKYEPYGVFFGENKTLILNGLTVDLSGFKTEENRCVALNVGCGFDKVELQGKNTVIGANVESGCETYGICSSGSLKFVGDGSLTVIGGNGGAINYGIAAVGGAELRFALTGGISVTTGENADTVCGIYNTGSGSSVVFEHGGVSVTALSGNHESNAIKTDVLYYYAGSDVAYSDLDRFDVTFTSSAVANGESNAVSVNRAVLRNDYPLSSYPFIFIGESKENVKIYEFENKAETAEYYSGKRYVKFDIKAILKNCNGQPDIAYDPSGEQSLSLLLPTWEGHTFTGYYDSLFGGNQIVKADGEITRDEELTIGNYYYAIWENDETGNLTFTDVVGLGIPNANFNYGGEIYTYNAQTTEMLKLYGVETTLDYEKQCRYYTLNNVEVYIPQAFDSENVEYALGMQGTFTFKGKTTVKSTWNNANARAVEIVNSTVNMDSGATLTFETVNGLAIKSIDITNSDQIYYKDKEGNVIENVDSALFVSVCTKTNDDEPKDDESNRTSEEDDDEPKTKTEYVFDENFSPINDGYVTEGEEYTVAFPNVEEINGSYEYTYYDLEDNKLDSAPTEAGRYKIKIAISKENAYYYGEHVYYFSIRSFTMTATDKETGKDIAKIEAENGIAYGLTLKVVKQETAPEVVKTSKSYKKTDEVFAVYSVSLTDQDSVERQPDGTVKLYLAIPQEILSRPFRILHVHGDVVTEVDYTTKDGYAVLITDSFSEFVFVGEKQSTQKPIWIVIVAVAVILTACIFTLIILKRINCSKKNK